jgi:hypothetical protein
MLMSEPNFNIDQIKKDVELIKKCVAQGEKEGITSHILLENKVFEDHHDIYEKYPWIVKHISKKRDMKYLNKMIEALEKVSKGETTVQDAGKELGEELAEKYLYPQFGKPKK